MIRITYANFASSQKFSSISKDRMLGIIRKYGQKKPFKKQGLKQQKKPKPVDFDEFKRRNIPKKPQFLLDNQQNQIESSTNTKQIESNNESSQLPNIEYKFDEKLGIMVPLNSTNPNQPLKNTEEEQIRKYEDEKFNQELEKVRKTPGKTMIKTMGRKIEIEAPKMKLTKYLSNASVMSTRAAKRLLKEGNILVNKKKVYENIKVSDYDKVEIFTKNGLKYVGKEEARLWVFYKPRGVVCTDYDPEGRITVMDYLRESKQILGSPKQLKSLKKKKNQKNSLFDYSEILKEESGEDKNVDLIEHVISVGRLDFNSEGLLLLTNDGDLARVLELPINRVEREYRVRVYGRFDENKLERVREGAIINGEQYGPFWVNVDKYQTRNTWLNIKMHQGKNREIRKVMQKNSLRVNRLQRKSYGPYTLMGLKPGEAMEVEIHPQITKMMYFAQRKKLEQYQADKPTMLEIEKKVLTGVEKTLNRELQRSEAVKERDQEIEELKRKYFLE